MTVRHHVVILTAAFVAFASLLAPATSTARAPGIGASAPNGVLRTAARISPPVALVPRPPAPAPAPSGDAQAEQRIVDMVNAERTARGLGPLTLNAQLAQAAEAHGLDQRNRPCRNLTHIGTDGSDVADRVDRTGYRWSRLAENIACGYSDAASVMKGWMDSDGHRVNILNRDLREVGVSLERSDSGATYWVQVFGTAG